MYKYLIIGPGAMAYFSFIGVLTKVDMSSIEEISGASAGAILGMFLACGKTIDEIIKFSLDLNLKELASVNLVSLFTKYGLIAMEPIKKKLKEFIGNPTFRELKKKLYVSAFCVNKSETEYFSVDTHPDMPVVDAICMSMAVPFLFECCKFGDFIYVDGGTTERLPSTAFLNKNPDEILSIKMIFDQRKTEIKDLRQFVTNLLTATLNNRHETAIGKVIYVDVGNRNIFDFYMTLEEKVKLFLLGQNLDISPKLKE